MVPTWLPLMFLGVAVSACAAVLEYRRHTVFSAFCSGIGSLLFIVIAIVTRMETMDKRYALIVVFGLILCALGSVTIQFSGGLERKFSSADRIGLAIFACGHIIYSYALVYRGFIAGVVAVPITILIAILITVSRSKRRTAPQKHRFLIMLYILMPVSIICWSLTLVVLNLPDSTYHLFTLGALGLMIFDSDLMSRLFTKSTLPITSAAALAAYSTGQLLVALSILFA